MPTLKLYYFDVVGKGESIRLLAEYAGLELEDYRFKDRDEFNALNADGTLPFGQVPLLEVNGTERLVQSAAILRYLAKLAGTYPEDLILAAKVDAALDQEADAFIGAGVVSYTTRFGIDLTSEQQKAAAELIGSEVMPRHLANLERILGESKTGWIAGTAEPSPADFAWVVRLAMYLPERDRIFPPELAKLTDYPRCKALCDKLLGLPEIKTYYEKKRFKP